MTTKVSEPDVNLRVYNHFVISPGDGFSYITLSANEQDLLDMAFQIATALKDIDYGKYKDLRDHVEDCLTDMLQIL